MAFYNPRSRDKWDRYQSSHIGAMHYGLEMPRIHSVAFVVRIGGSRQNPFRQPSWYETPIMVRSTWKSQAFPIYRKLLDCQNFGSLGGSLGSARIGMLLYDLRGSHGYARSARDCRKIEIRVTEPVKNDRLRLARQEFKLGPLHSRMMNPRGRLF